MPKTIAQKAAAPLSRSDIMKRVKQKDTAAELALRSALHGLGLRYRLHCRIESVTVDVVFPTAKVAIFIDGCFWHGCPVHATKPKSNQSYWLPKLAENKARDMRQSEKLRSAGWFVIRSWEHECLLAPWKIAQRIESIVLRRRQARGSIDAT